MLPPRKPLGGQYVGAGGALVTPEQVAQQKQIAAALLEQAGDTSPVGHWSAALNRGLQGWLGGRDMYRARQAESEGTSKALERFNTRNSGAGAASRVAEALAGGVASSATQGGAASPIKLDGNKESFIQALLPTALEVSEQTGVDPRIIIAQAAQETGWGRSAPNNNFFGIKSHGKSGGGTFATTEYVNGQPVTIRDSFRGYETPADSVRDYGNFLLSNPRYKPMLAASGDLDAQIAALGASGYATDPNYANAIRNIATGLDLSAFGVSPGAGITQAPAASNVSEIASLLADPWLPKDAKAVLQAEMNQQMQMQNAAYEMQLQQQDPMRQLEMQRAQLELDQLRNPGRPKPIEVGGVLLDAETFQPIFDSRSAPGAQSAAGKIQADLAAGFITPEQAELAFSKLGNQTNVTTNLGGDKYWDKVGENQAAAFSEMSASGFSAAQNLGNLDRLESLLAQGPSGASAALQNLAANYGIDVGNAGPLQAANALIQAMIPAQRPPGSGPMSDKDIEMFKASLPRLINSPEGNALIIQTLRGIAQYDMQRAEIADRAMLPPEDPNHLPRNEASRMLRQLRSPLSDFGKEASQFKAESQDGQAVRFETMEDLLNADITSMTDAEMDAWEARMKELQNGGN